jgi:VanZ family protein
MKKLLLLIPILIFGGVIYLSSELLTVPPGTQWHSQYVALDATAHVFLYFFLGFFVAYYVSDSLQVRALGTLVLTGALCLTFGVGDEFHQMYIPNRGAEFRDLFWDLIGALAGGLLYVMLAGLVRWIREFLISAEVGIGTMLGRAAVALTLLLSILVPSIVYAGAIADFFHSLAKAGSSSASAAICSYLQKSPADLPPTHQTLEIVQYAFESSSEAFREERGSENNAMKPRNTESKRNSMQLQKVSRQDIQKIKEELRQEILRELRDEGVTESAKNHVNAHSAGQQHVAGNSQVEDVAEPQNSLVTLTSLGENSMVRNKIIQALGGNPAAQRQPESSKYSRRKVSTNVHPYGVGTKKPDRCDLVAIITPLSNPIDELSLDQVRKIYSGEYQNWNQVGGLDQPIRVVTARKRSGSVGKTLATHLQVPLARNATRLPLLSFVIPVVAETKGAVGFLPLKDTEQLDWLVNHEAFKKIAIKSNIDSVPVVPDRMALITAQYPIMK